MLPPTHPPPACAAGRDARYSPQAKAEAALLLDLLCTALLAPGQPDAGGLRYVRWACRHLQGGPVRRDASPYWHTYDDCGEALRRCPPEAAPPPNAAGGKPQGEAVDWSGGFAGLHRLSMHLLGQLQGTYTTT